jgi:hypothetical protein
LRFVQSTVNLVKGGKRHHCGVIGENGRHFMFSSILGWCQSSD